MKRQDHWLLVGAAVIAVTLAAPQVRAVGTLSNTSIDNRATVDYEVNNTPQELIESAPGGNNAPGVGNGADTTFLVDDKVDITVAEESAGYTTVSTGALAQVLSFTVTNTGNTLHDFSLSATDQAGGAGPFGGTDNFNATGGGIFVDVDDDGLYSVLTDTATFIDELAADGDVRVFIVRDIPAGLAENDLSAVVLTAQVAVGGAIGVQGADILTDDSAVLDDPALVQIVFADGPGDDAADLDKDGSHSDTDGYTVTTAQLTISKTSQVLSDPFNLTVNPKAIPGAIVEYTITVTNDVGASATATAIQVADSLDTEIVAGTVIFEVDGYAVGEGIEVTAPNLYGGVATSLTNTADADEGSFALNVVSVSGIELDPGESATVTFQVEIQ